MPSTYKAPGVYIEEISKFPPSVAEVETAIPAFIGYTQKAVINGLDLHDSTPVIIQPVRITSLLEYEQSCGKTEAEAGITITIEEQIDGSTPPNVTERRVTGAIATPSKHNMYYAMQAYFDNGGGPCYVVSIGKIETAAGVITGSELEKGIAEIAKEDEVTLFVFPESQGLDDAGRIGVFGKTIFQ